MEFAIQILKKELNKWSVHYESEKIYYKGEERETDAMRSFKECQKKINELQEAISKLQE